MRGVGRLLRLPGDRQVEVWEGGQVGGLPVLFHHGTPASRLQAELGAETAGRQGIQLVSFDRPGYGRSSDTPPSLASVGADTVRVADALGIGDFAVLGASGGGPYAVATGLADPARVRAVGIVVGIGPWRLIDPADPDDPDAPLLTLADRGDVAGALAGFRAQGEVAFHRMLDLPDAAMIEEFFSGAPEGDLGWLDARAKEVWAADLREALQSYDGYARDNVTWGGDWDVDPARLEVPTWLWYGELDRMVSTAHGQWLAEKIPNSTLVVRPGKGHGSTIFEFWDDMFATLAQQLRSEPR